MNTVGIMMPGDMGHAVGRVLREGGLRVVTCLQGRSARTWARAVAAGIKALPDDAALVREADVVLSILAPAHAPALAERIAGALRATGETLLFVDCNAVAPQTVLDIGAVLTDAGARFVDAGIIGGPPKPGTAGPRFYASGPGAAELLSLRDAGLDVRLAGSAIGQASGLKMCYAAMSKGFTALATEALMAARLLGLEAELRTELAESQGALLAWIERALPGMPLKAWRWVGEMEEIAATFGAVGLPPELFEAIAAFYGIVAQQVSADGKALAPDSRAADVIARLADLPASS